MKGSRCSAPESLKLGGWLTPILIETFNPFAKLRIQRLPLNGARHVIASLTNDFAGHDYEDFPSFLSFAVPVGLGLVSAGRSL